MAEDVKAAVTLEVPLELLKTEKKTFKSSIAEATYNAVGTNGLIEADPEILKFAGFELNKINTKRILIRNTSGMPRRIYVLPATTKAFTFICSKKGNIAPGMSEEVFVRFVPETFKYHYDCLRIQAEGNNFIVPIHAYPVMSKKSRVIPKLIDLGIREVDSTITKTIELQSEIPVDFEYELNILKQHQDITINPLKGEIKGESKEEIRITYAPKAKSTAVCEFELHLSEFDFQPQICRVSGSGIPKPPKSPQSRRESVMEFSRMKGGQSRIIEKIEKTEKKPSVRKTLLSLKGSGKSSFLIRPSSVKTKKVPAAETVVVEKMPKEVEKQTRALAQGLNPNVLIFEENFVKNYHLVETQLKEREIKFFQCIGDPALTEAEREEIISTRLDNHNYKTEFKRDNDLQRYSAVSSNERVVVPSDLKIETNCKWNVLGNDLFSLRQRNLSNLVKMSTTILTRIRASLRLHRLKARFEEENVRSKEDAEKLVHEDWKESKKVIVGEEASKGWKFEVDFSGRDFEAIRLPVEYDMGVSTFKETVEPTEISSFDDLVEYPPLELLDHELHKYEPLNIPAYFNYFPVESSKPLRPGAEYEYSIRGTRGDPELGNKDPENRFVPTPATMVVPLHYSPERLVVPNSLLRVYIQPERYTEVDVDHHLQPGIRPGVDVPDEISLNHKFTDKDTLTLSKYLPGNVGSRITQRVQTRLTDFFVPTLAVHECYAAQATSKAFPAKIVENDAKLDQFTESGSDDQNKFETKVADVDDLLKEFEQGDATMKEIRQNQPGYVTQYASEQAKLNKNISMERIAVAAKVHTAIEQLNANIGKPQHKLYF